MGSSPLLKSRNSFSSSSPRFVLHLLGFVRFSRRDHSNYIGRLPITMTDYQHPQTSAQANDDEGSSSAECCSSGTNNASSSRNTVSASWNETRCFRRLLAAFPASHSNRRIHTFYSVTTL